MWGKRTLCWCLGSRAPPEISYGLENGGMTLKPIELDLPMPQDEETLNAKFAELVDELDLDKPHREAMFALPPAKKWQIYCSNRKDHEEAKPAVRAETYIEQVRSISRSAALATGEDTAGKVKAIDNLKTALRTQPVSFVVRFIETGGVQCLVEFLAGIDMDGAVAHSNMHTAVIGCIKALMNSSQGRSNILAHSDAINVIAQSLKCDNIKAKIAVLEILGAMCLVPGGHKKVLQAFLHFQRYAGERTRFQSLILDLDRNTWVYKDEVNLKTAIMSFINAALKYGAGQNNLEFRLHLRYEFLMLGIQPVIEKLYKIDNPTLERHLELFELIRTEDERELAKKFDVSRVDSKSANALFDVLRKKTNHSVAFQHFMSIMFHLLHLPYGNSINGKQGGMGQWQLIDRIIQQIVLQNKDGDPDVEAVEIDTKKIVKLLANEDEMKAFQQKMREVQKENDELNSKLAKKEREIEAQAEEKEELINTMNSMKTKLEKEMLGHQEAKTQVQELTAQLEELHRMMECERSERMKLEHAVKTGSLPDDAKVGFTSYSSSFITPPPLPPMFSGAPAPPPPPPPNFSSPPPPPPLANVPAPPAPPSFSSAGVRSSTAVGYTGNNKKIPTPQNPMKSFNWAKLPDNKVTGTLWNDIDESKMYKTLDLNEFERTFSAYQKQDSNSDSDIYGKQAKVKELSVIDGRRAQNCTILLSKLKMSNSELSVAINSMDPHGDLPKDMCEQLLKFVPTPEETQMLGEHEHELDQMAKADRFLFEMSKIDHYEQKLKALYFKKKFSERMADCKPKIECVLEASKEVFRSKKLKKVFEIVLAFGNYMNRGNRSNASGFKISSLNKIIDTKSSIDKKITLLHYLLEVIEKLFPDLLSLQSELKHVKPASKVNMTELESEISLLRGGLKEIEKEIEYHKNKFAADSIGKNKFVSVMRDFITIATYNFSEMEDAFKEMKQKFELAVKTFAEETNSAQPDDFFGVFDLFLTSFSEAHAENEKFRRQKEEEEKRAKLEAQRQLEKERLRASRSLGGCGRPGRSGSEVEEKGEFDDLISALRTGDVFSEDMAKLNKRNRRRVSRDRVLSERERTGKFQ